jgi:DNA polymerase-3 subunit delta
MRVKPEGLDRHLCKPLAPVYVVTGPEPLLVQEVGDRLRKAALEQGFTERERLEVDARFDWTALAFLADSPSLFATRRLIELRMDGAKPGDEGGRALRRYCDAPPPDTVLLVLLGQLERSAQNSKWFQTLERAGVWIQTWSVETHQLPAWIDARMRARGLVPDRDAVALLADRVEGNLLAAAQEVDRLALTLGGGEVDAPTVVAAVSDNARYDVFDLTDAALAGLDGARLLRILTTLRREGVEPVLVVWAFAREIRTLCALSKDAERGMAIEAVLTRNRVWERRKPIFRKALRRANSDLWRRLLVQCAELDRLVKGQRTGSVWNELLQLSMDMAGRAAFADAGNR